MALKDRVKALVDAGYLTESKVAEMLGRQASGDMKDMLEKAGIKPIQIQHNGDSGRVKRLWHKDDIAQYLAKSATLFNAKPANGDRGNENIMRRLDDIEARITRLELLN